MLDNLNCFGLLLDVKGDSEFRFGASQKGKSKILANFAFFVMFRETIKMAAAICEGLNASKEFS